MTNTALGYPEPDDGDRPSWLRADPLSALPAWLTGCIAGEVDRSDDPLFSEETLRKARAMGEARRRHQEMMEMRATEREPMWSPRPLVGYRMWDISLNGLVGRTGYTWPSPQLRAECRRNRYGQKAWDGAPHRKDDEGCVGLCGVNAYRTADIMVSESMNHPVGFRPGRPVLNTRGAVPSGAYGVVSMWGRVIEHNRGYRSEHARTVGVVVVTNTWAGAIVGSDGLALLFVDPFLAFRDDSIWDPIPLDRHDPAAARTAMVDALETIGGNQ